MRGPAAGALLHEICLDDIDGVSAVVEAGAHRIELCANQAEGGITPSLGTLEAALSRCGDIPVHVLIRPRLGDFVYSPAEVEVMIRDALAARRAGAHGLVMGALGPDGGVDQATMARLREAAGPLPVTFHRAFDSCADLDAALDAVVALGCARVLTSGGAVDAPAGRAVLGRLVQRAGDDIIILAGGGIRAHNVAGVVAASGVREVHYSANVVVGDRRVTQASTIRAVMAAARHARPPVSGAVLGSNSDPKTGSEIGRDQQ